MSMRIRGHKPRRRTFLRQWREYRGLTLEKAAARFPGRADEPMSAAQLSRIETGKSAYTQDFLELAADVYQTDIASLLMRDPSQPEAIWSIWDSAKPGERRELETMIRTWQEVRRRA